MTGPSVAPQPEDTAAPVAHLPVAATRRVEYGGVDGKENRYTHLLLGCPGCGGFHTVYVNTEPGDTGAAPWDWDGNLDAPTVSPSVLVNATREGRRCHSFMRSGRWEFLADCDHALAGQTVPLGPLPEWCVRELTDGERPYRLSGTTAPAQAKASRAQNSAQASTDEASR